MFLGILSIVETDIQYLGEIVRSIPIKWHELTAVQSAIALIDYVSVKNSSIVVLRSFI